MGKEELEKGKVKKGKGGKNEEESKRVKMKIVKREKWNWETA